MQTNTFRQHTGVWIGASIILLWALALIGFLHLAVDYQSPWPYVGTLLMTHLYTGLFITAHDSMHRLVSPNAKVNEWIGRICTTLFAYNFYGNLYKKHHEHHRFVGTEKDPDYRGGNFWLWYLSFARQYVNVWQILLMACTYHFLKLFFAQENVVLFWMVPSILSTFQLFYFGTYLPHRGEHAADDPHKSKSQQRNHLWAFISCYFFGYHYEHHSSPRTPWWRLPAVKDANEATSE